MLWGKIGNYFGGGQPFVSQAYIGKNFDTLRLSNGIYDEVKIDETLDSPNATTKENWLASTVFDAKFQNNLEAGNIQNQSLPIQYLLFERQEQGSLRWEQMCKIPYIKGTDNYSLVDYYIKHNKLMNYRFSPVCQQTIGSGMTTSVKTSYTRLFLTDSKFNCNCGYDLVINEVQTVTNATTIETLTGKYPAVLNSASKYRKGKIGFTALSLDSIRAFGNVNSTTTEAENVLNEKIEEFLTDGKPKLMRYNNLFVVVKILNITRVTDSNHSVFSIWEWNVEWVEVDNTEMQSLLKNNLTYNVDSSNT